MWFMLILILAGCATATGSGFARLSQVGPSYACAASLMGFEAIGPVPTLVYSNDLPRDIDGIYNRRKNLITVRPFYRLESAVEILGHENAHAVLKHNDMPKSEDRAYLVGSTMSDCIDG